MMKRKENMEAFKNDILSILNFDVTDRTIDKTELYNTVEERIGKHFPEYTKLMQAGLASDIDLISIVNPAPIVDNQVYITNILYGHDVGGIKNLAKEVYSVFTKEELNNFYTVSKSLNRNRRTVFGALEKMPAIYTVCKKIHGVLGVNNSKSTISFKLDNINRTILPGEKFIISYEDYSKLLKEHRVRKSPNLKPDYLFKDNQDTIIKEEYKEAYNKMLGSLEGREPNRTLLMKAVTDNKPIASIKLIAKYKRKDQTLGYMLKLAYTDESEINKLDYSLPLYVKIPGVSSGGGYHETNMATPGIVVLKKEQLIGLVEYLENYFGATKVSKDNFTIDKVYGRKCVMPGRIPEVDFGNNENEFRRSVSLSFNGIEIDRVMVGMYYLADLLPNRYLE